MTVKTAFLGAGGFSNFHFKSLQKVTGVELTAIVEKDLETAARMAEKFGVSSYTDSLDDVLHDPEIDAVHCLLPNSMHYEVLKQAISAGKHVIAEKPLTLNTSQSLELVRLAEARQVVHAINFHYRYFLPVLEIRRAIKEDSRDVRCIRAAFQQDWLCTENDYNWRLNAASEWPSSTIADIGSHVMDLICFVTGQKPARISGFAKTIIPYRYTGSGHDSRIKVDAEDYAVLFMEMESGSPCSVTLSQVSPGNRNFLEFEVATDKKSYKWNFENQNTLWVGSRSSQESVRKREWDYQEAGNGGMIRLLKAFYSSVSHVKEFGTANRDKGDFPDFSDGLLSNKCIEAAYESLGQDSSITIL